MVIEERLTDDLKKEIVPLLRKHQQEITFYKDEPININWKIYDILDKSGLLKIFISRTDGELTGYLVFTLSPSLHHQHLLVARQDIFYVREDNRGTMLGTKLVKYADIALKKLGVDCIYQSMCADNKFEALLERQGYSMIENTFIKRL